MDTIGVQDLWSFKDGADVAEVVKCREVRIGQGNRVSSYAELAGKIAELQFRNRDYVFLYRGQARDHQDTNGLSTLLPSIFRRQALSTDFSTRFVGLRRAEQVLMDRFGREPFLGHDELSRHKVLRWAVLQHYEICETPLLDVTQSLRIAASFSTDRNDTDEAFLYVLGVPNISGAITASAEAGIQCVRLSGICPPEAMRPHLQEGYLLGNYPEIDTMDEKQLYGLPELDFGKRLVAKFIFSPRKFWTKSGQFQAVGRRSLYPSVSNDPLLRVADSVTDQLSRR